MQTQNVAQSLIFFAQHLKVIHCMSVSFALELLKKKCKVVKCEMPVEGKAKLEKDQAGR